MEINDRENHQNQGDWLEKTRGNLVVAATVIATMSFAVMVNPPGGVWQSDPCSSGDQNGRCMGLAGTSVLEYKPSKRDLYLGMVISNLVSFSASMGLILLVIIGFRLRNRFIMALMVMFMVLAVLCISLAFFFAVALVQHDDEIILGILRFYLGFWVVFPVLVFLIQLVRFLWWLIKCICCGCRRRQRSSPQLLPLGPPPAS